MSRPVLQLHADGSATVTVDGSIAARIRDAESLPLTLSGMFFPDQTGVTWRFAVETGDFEEVIWPF